MKVLILGAGGQVGKALVAVAPKGHDVTALGHEACDLADPVRLEAAVAQHRPDILFNAAAYTAVDQAESDEAQAQAINARAPARLAALAEARGFRFVHISTDFVFDGAAGRPYRPDDPTNPLGVYGRTKRDGEAAVAAASPAALIVRSAWIYDARGANFPNTMLRLMRERDDVRVVADQVGTPTHAASLAGALWALAERGASGLYHYTDAGVASWYDFAVAIAEEATACGLLDQAPRIIPVGSAEFPRPAPRPFYSVLDKTATWLLLGAAPPHWRVNLRAALQEIAGHG